MSDQHTVKTLEGSDAASCPAKVLLLTPPRELWNAMLGGYLHRLIPVEEHAYVEPLLKSLGWGNREQFRLFRFRSRLLQRQVDSSEFDDE